VKVTDVDPIRKRIALSIKQTVEAPEKRTHKVYTQKNGHINKQKARVNESASMEDAINVLRRKFGK
jgi:ribosomal protein S1